MRILIAIVVAIVGLSSTAPAQAQRDAPTSFDAWGYRQRSSPHPACPLQWIDLGAGTPLALAAAGDADADDDGAAAIGLPLPFRFYGEDRDAIVVSSNGYLAFAAGTADEDGGHWRSDCPLPAIPANRAARYARIHALLADLERGDDGDLRWAHFGTCPRNAALGVEACTVVQWMHWRRRGSDAFVDMQVVLYHASGEIAVQYGSIDAAAASGATFGIQDDAARSAVQLACGGAAAPTAASAACYFADAPIVQVAAVADPVTAGTTGGSGDYVRGDEVAVTATPGDGQVFLDWREGGIVQSIEPTYVFTANSDRNLVARFAATTDVLFRHGFEGITP